MPHLAPGGAAAGGESGPDEGSTMSRIIAEVPVPLPHPRVPKIRTDPEFTRVVREVVSLLGSAADAHEED